MKKIHLSVIVASLFALCSCSKIGEMSSKYFAVTPQVLEAVNGEVPVTISGTFPEKFFPKKAVITATPVLKWEGGSVEGETYTFIGEKVEGNNQMIPYATGGNFTMKSTYDYVPEMAKSELFVEFSVEVNGKAKALPAVKVVILLMASSFVIKNFSSSSICIV